MCQAFLTGIPVIAVVKDIPEAFYLVTVFLLFILSMVLLCLIFLPKILIQWQYSQLPEPEQKRMLTISVRRSAVNSGRSSSRCPMCSNTDLSFPRRIAGLVELPLPSSVSCLTKASGLRVESRRESQLVESANSAPFGSLPNEKSSEGSAKIPLDLAVATRIVSPEESILLNESSSGIVFVRESDTSDRKDEKQEQTI